MLIIIVFYVHDLNSHKCNVWYNLILHKSVENTYGLELWIRPGPCRPDMWNILTYPLWNFIDKTLLKEKKKTWRIMIVDLSYYSIT